MVHVPIYTCNPPQAVLPARMMSANAHVTKQAKSHDTTWLCMVARWTNCTECIPYSADVAAYRIDRSNYTSDGT